MLLWPAANTYVKCMMRNLKPPEKLLFKIPQLSFNWISIQCIDVYHTFILIALLVAVAPILLFITVCYIPETPSFLVLAGRDDDAYR